MGQMVKNLYVGAFFESPDFEKFREIFYRDNFYDKFEGRFMFPYEGLENEAVLLPLDTDGSYSCIQASENEGVFDIPNDAITDLLKNNLSKDYQDILEYFIEIDCPIDVRVGIVFYDDEIA